MSSAAAPSAATQHVPRPNRKTPLWAKLLLGFFVLLLVAAAAYGGLALGKYLGAGEARDTQVVRSVEREEQVILLSAGISGVKEARGEGQKLFGLFNIPGSERALFIQYAFDAKLGIEGKDVKILKTGDSAYRITIPEFISLGYDNPDFSVATESNGLLSWTTPEIDKFEVEQAILDDEAVTTDVENFRPLLEVQAQTFYTNLITAIDPAIQLEFEFEQ